MLAIPKKAFKITMSSGGHIIVLLDKEVDRANIIRNKAVVSIDDRTINGSYIAYVEEIIYGDDKSDTALAYAKKIKGALGCVAIERVRSYEAAQGHNMPVQSIEKRINSFVQKGQNKEYSNIYDKYLSIYTKNGGDLSLIGDQK